MNLLFLRTQRRRLVGMVVLTLVVAFLAIPALSRTASAATAAPTIDPIVGDWSAKYRETQAVVTMSRSGGSYTETAKSPFQLSGSSCTLPPGTILATFSGSGNMYSGQHGLWHTGDCSFGAWTSLSLTLSGSTLTGVLGGGFGTVTFTKVASNQPGLYAFGDSIATGYGIAPLPGTNAQAYPALLAQKLNLPYNNFANVGACASRADGTFPRSNLYPSGETRAGCDSFTSVSEQITSAPKTPQPRLITLTIGGNDIQFDSCFEAALTGLGGNPAVDPCTLGNLNKNLKLFGKSLASNLADLAAAFPGVPVLLTNYYNPMPRPVTSSNAICSLTPPVTLAIVMQAPIPLRDKLAVIEAAIPGAPHHQDFLNGEVGIQRALYDRGATAAGTLNSSIDNAALSAKNKVTPVPLNFSGHDMCQNGTTAWVFGPDLHVSVTWTPAFLPEQTVSFGFGPFPSVCPHIDPNLDMQHDKIILLGTKDHLQGFWHDLLTTNCMPHPTAAGQQAIANALYPFSPHT